MISEKIAVQENKKTSGNAVRRYLTRAENYLASHPAFLAFVLSLSVVLINEILSRRSLIGTVKFVFLSPIAFFCNVAVIMVFEAAALLTKRRNYMTALFTFLWIGMGIVNFIVRCFRQTPFSAMDFTLVKSVFPILVVYLTWYGLIGCIVLILAVLVALFVLWLKAEKKRVAVKRSLVTFAASLVCGVALILISYLTGVLPKRFSNLADAYNDYGFSYCFAVSIVDRGVMKPDGYDDDIEYIVSDILDEDTEAPEEERKPNVIFVQLESFYDLKLLSGFEFESDPTPSFTELKATSEHGILTVPSVGAGTANTEFEVLTGMSLSYFGAGEYPYETILQKKTCESICYNLKNHGYSAHAVHNYKGNFYDRSNVFSRLGFDTFTSVEYMNGYKENMLGWAEDIALTEYVISALKSTDDPDFVYCITVQAHGKYPTSDFENENQHVKISAYPQDANRFGFDYYVDQLHGTDGFIGSLISSVELLGEDTVIVFFGDHIPNIGFTDEWLADGMTAYDTEYVIWNNFGMKSGAAQEKLTSYQLSAYVMSLLGYDDGVVTKLHQTKKNSESYQKYLEMLEYDILYGDCVSYGGKNPFPQTEIRMGIKPILITDARNYGDSIYITGENFTEASSVTINGSVKQTEYVSPTTLVLNGERIEQGDELTVVQISDLIFRLSESETYICK